MDLSYFATWYLNCEKYKIQTYPDLISTHALRQTQKRSNHVGIFATFAAPQLVGQQDPSQAAEVRC